MVCTYYTMGLGRPYSFGIVEKSLILFILPALWTVSSAQVLFFPYQKQTGNLSYADQGIITKEYQKRSKNSVSA